MSERSEHNETTDAQGSVLETLRQLKSGELPPKHLGPEGRQPVVAHLIGEGWSTPEMARLLQRSDRQISRDRRAVQQRHAPRRDEAEVDVAAGRLRLEAEASIARIRRAARDAEAAPRDRIEAERAVWDVLQRCTQLLQSLGYLPRAAQRVSAEVTHHDGEAPSFSELEDELIELQILDGDDHEDPEVRKLAEVVDRGRRAAKRGPALDREPENPDKEQNDE